MYGVCARFRTVRSLCAEDFEQDSVHRCVRTGHQIRIMTGDILVSLVCLLVIGVSQSYQAINNLFGSLGSVNLSICLPGSCVMSIIRWY